MDFRKKLKTRLYFAIAYISLGLALSATAYATGTDNYFIPSFGIALLVSGIVRLFRYRRILKDEKTVKRQEVTETDERNIMLAHKARSLAFAAYISLSGMAVIFLSFCNMHELAQLFSYSICLLVMIYWICHLILRRKY